MVHQNEEKYQKMREIHLQWYFMLREKNGDMNSIPSNLREHYSQPHFDVKLFLFT